MMKTIMLAGGYGTRLSEEIIIKPKPMMEIGDNPLLWHVMNIVALLGELLGRLAKRRMLCCQYHDHLLAVRSLKK